MRIIDRITRDRWEIGFVEGGLAAVMGDFPLQVRWLKHPYRDRWFADPFVLDVTDNEIQLLVEEFCYELGKGRIAMLTVDKMTCELKSMNILLELPTHISFPAIWREKGRVFIYPESWKSGRLSLYEIKDGRCNPTEVQMLCEESVADAIMTERFGKRQLFAVKENDKLRIYNYDAKKHFFVLSYMKPFGKSTARNAGDFFEYDDEVYRPAQVCENRYGEAVEIQRVIWDNNNNFCFIPHKTLYSNHVSLDVGMHTLNSYKGVVVIDVRGWDHAFTVKSLLAMKKMLCREERKK